MCMVLLNGVEDHVADAAGVSAAQPWRDTDTGSKFPVSTFSISAHRKQQLCSSKSASNSENSVLTCNKSLIFNSALQADSAN